MRMRFCASELTSALEQVRVRERRLRLERLWDTAGTNTAIRGSPSSASLSLVSSVHVEPFSLSMEKLK